MSNNQQALEGVRILDMTRLYPGALCTLILADLGAEVLKIEAPEGDYWRQLSPESFAVFNRNKRAAALDLKTQAGVGKLLALVADADVLLESFRPGVMDRFGLTIERLHGINPRLIIASLSGYGQDGPRRDEAGHDINYMGYTGILDQVAMPPIVQAADALGGFSMANAIMAALFRRERTGQGAVLDICLLDAALAAGIMPLAGMHQQPNPPPPRENWLMGGLACYGLYVTRDQKQMALGALETKFFQAFCKAVSRPDLIPAQYDRSRQHWLRNELEAIFLARTRSEWVAFLEKEQVDACCTPVLTAHEAAHDPGVKARDMLETGADGLIYTRSPVRLQDASPPPVQPAPDVGQHDGWA